MVNRTGLARSSPFSPGIPGGRREGRLRHSDDPFTSSEPSATFTVAGRLDLPSRRDPLLLEVARVDLPAECYAKAVPVMTPQVYRLARLTTSSGLSGDALYQRTARMDNLLRWDIDVPRGTVGDKTIYINYEFHLEYARDFAPPRFVAGGLREGPIGGGAMGMGGMGGGFR